MSSNDTPIGRAKKGVALSGIAAGSTALCTVGRSGNDLHYRGYDIYDIAETCEFEELAYLLIYGEMPHACATAQLQGQAPAAARPRSKRCLRRCLPPHTPWT